MEGRRAPLLRGQGFRVVEPASGEGGGSLSGRCTRWALGGGPVPPLLSWAAASLRSRADAVHDVHWVREDICALLFVSAQNTAFLPTQLHHDHAVRGPDEVRRPSCWLRVRQSLRAMWRAFPITRVGWLTS